MPTDALNNHLKETISERLKDERKPVSKSGYRTHYLDQHHRETFTLEKGRLYQSDFFNPFLDFNDFSLKLPGFSLNVIKYIDSKTHELRYTLKNRKTDEVYAVVMFTLSWGGELEEVEKEVDGEEEGSEDEFEDAEEGGKEEDKTEKKGKKSEDIPDDDEGVD